MFRPPFLPDRRRAVILLVVVSLLTLFSVIGLSFVLYADAQATSARLAGEAQAAARPNVEPELLLSYFLGQLIYDVPDDESGVYSALRGHSLARSMFGWNDQNPGAHNVPFNGTGRLHTGRRGPSDGKGPAEPGSFYNNPFCVDDFYLVNYTFFRDGNDPERFLRDPERLAPDLSLLASWRTDPAQPRGRYAGGFNAPYTYPDLNSMFLAAVKADGTVLLPSFHRPWTDFGPLEPVNENWRRNETSTDRILKYLTLRPRPAEHDGFPPPEDGGGDVKNLVGSPGTLIPGSDPPDYWNNDSVWLDLGFPVLKTPDGRKFKPLFAPLIVDLDNRINLNVHGNIRRGEGGGPVHASNQGWGPWEVNVGSVLHRGNEWANLFVGSSRLAQPGRYGDRTRPGSGAVAPEMPTPPFYAQVDFDGYNEWTRAPSGGVLLPGPGGAPALSCFPQFNLPDAFRGYGQASLRERTGHPLLFNVFQPSGGDRVFGLSNMEALLRYGDTGSPALTSELFRLCPQNFADPRLRRLVTTHSFDVDRPGVSPWAWQGVEPYALRGGEPGSHPVGGPLSFPTSETPPDPVHSEFTADWRAKSAELGRLDLNRPLPRYPTPASAGVITDVVGFQVAQTARQQLAEDVFLRLRAVTGVGHLAALSPGTPAFNAARWLAQLAVNIVDYLDADEYMTPFFWNPAHPTAVVFGTELPRLVLNEVYAEWRHRAVGEEGIEVKLWVELHNPFPADDALPDAGAARLRGTDGQNRPYGIYQLVVTDPNPEDNILQRPENVRGDPDPGAIPTVLDFTDLAQAPDRIEPANGQPDRGFYVAGPGPLALGQGVILPTLSTQRLKYEGGEIPNPPTLLLRRLACPHLPPNPRVLPNGLTSWDINLPQNLYITVDHLERVRLNRADAGPELRASEGREQPYAAARRFAHTPPPDGPAHTFFRHNERSQTPFDWLVHLDRPLISPMELLHVSGFKPHELTQQFMTGEQRFGHRAPWFHSAARIYRVFEFLATRPRAAGFEPVGLRAQGPVIPGTTTLSLLSLGLSSGAGTIRTGDVLLVEPGTEREENVRVTEVPRAGTFTATFLRRHPERFEIVPTTLGGRVAGRINLNTIWDEETFLALCDAQPANSFQDDHVMPMFQRLIELRTPGPDGRPDHGDRPIRGMAAGFVPDKDQQHRNGLDVNDTFLRSEAEGGGPDEPRLFQVPATTHPYQQYELMTKLFNQVTTRSNVFAVWLTVGFFEVADDAARPVKLGAELGRAENRHVRHRMFAVVDRSVLIHNPGPQPRFDPRGTSPGTAPAAPPYARKVVPYFSIID